MKRNISDLTKLKAEIYAAIFVGRLTMVDLLERIDKLFEERGVKNTGKITL